jgi:nitroreductase
VALTDHAPLLLPLLRARVTPEAFDGSRSVSKAEAATLVDAFRWAPSAGNSQPWGLLLAHRGDETHDRLVARLAPSSRRWAPSAALLAVTAVRRFVDDSDMPYSEFADYDLGQAVAHLTVQAEALGLATHQFRAFDLDGLAGDLAPRPGWAIVSMIAIGHAATPPAHERSRRSAHDIRSAPWSTAT